MKNFIYLLLFSLPHVLFAQYQVDFPTKKPVLNETGTTISTPEWDDTLYQLVGILPGMKVYNNDISTITLHTNGQLYLNAISEFGRLDQVLKIKCRLIS